LCVVEDKDGAKHVEKPASGYVSAVISVLPPKFTLGLDVCDETLTRCPIYIYL